MSYIKIQKIAKENIGIPEKGHIYMGYDDTNYGKGLWIKDDDGSAAYYIITETLPIPVITSFAPTSAVVGDTVIINGYNFVENDTVVTFNGFFATSIVFLSVNQISVVIPSVSVGSATVVVSTPHGSSSYTTFTIIEAPYYLSGNDPIGLNNLL